MKPIITLAIPKYTKNQKPNYESIGKLVDTALKEHFSGKDIGIRCISLQDHPGKSLDDLIRIIDKMGTDKYDSQRKMSVAHDFYTAKGVELFATPTKVTSKMKMMDEVLKDFYEGAVKDRGYSLKIDLLIIYDLEKLALIPIQYDDGIGKDAYRFRHPESKVAAVLGFVKVI